MQISDEILLRFGAASSDGYSPLLLAGAEANWGTEWQGFATAPWERSESLLLSQVSAETDSETGKVIFTLTFTDAQQSFSYERLISSSSGLLSIPASLTVEGAAYTITSIGEEAFAECQALTEVIIPNTVTEIGNRAFLNCASLSNVIIPNSVTSIGEEAFAGCVSLAQISIPDSVKQIGSRTFAGCSSLQNIALGNGLSEIGTEAFADCEALKGIYFRSVNPPTVGENIFSGCPEDMIIYIYNNTGVNWGSTWQGYPTQSWQYTTVELTKASATVDSESGEVSFTLTFSDSILLEITDSTGFLSIPSFFTVKGKNYAVASISKEAFKDCQALTGIVIPDSVSMIKDAAFRNCSSLINVTLGNGLILIGNDAFQSCESLTEIHIPDSVLSIGIGAFMNCSSLTEVTLSENIRLIDEFTFDGCISLPHVVIPDSVTTIGERAFYNCTSLTAIQVSENNSSYQSIEGILFSKDGTLLHTYPAGKTPITDSAGGWILCIRLLS